MIPLNGTSSAPRRHPDKKTQEFLDSVTARAFSARLRERLEAVAAAQEPPRTTTDEYTSSHAAFRSYGPTPILTLTPSALVSPSSASPAPSSGSPPSSTSSIPALAESKPRQSPPMSTRTHDIPACLGKRKREDEHYAAGYPQAKRRFVATRPLRLSQDKCAQAR